MGLHWRSDLVIQCKRAYANLLVTGENHGLAIRPNIQEVLELIDLRWCYIELRTTHSEVHSFVLPE